MFCAKLESLNIYLEILNGKSYNGITSSNYINLHKIIYSYAAIIFEKLKKPI
jgi:hypothetical protein